VTRLEALLELLLWKLEEEEEELLWLWAAAAAAAEAFFCWLRRAACTADSMEGTRALRTVCTTCCWSIDEVAAAVEEEEDVVATATFLADSPVPWRATTPREAGLEAMATGAAATWRGTTGGYCWMAAAEWTC
jgi:hypothetical protein